MRVQRKHLINITKENNMDIKDLKWRAIVWWVKKDNSKGKNFVAKVEVASRCGFATAYRVWVKVIQIRQQGYNSHIEVGQLYSPWPSELVQKESEIGEVQIIEWK